MYVSLEDISTMASDQFTYDAGFTSQITGLSPETTTVFGELTPIITESIKGFSSCCNLSLITNLFDLLNKTQQKSNSVEE